MQARAKRAAEETEAAQRIAYEVRCEFEKEEAARVAAKGALVEFLAGNEVHKRAKEAEKARQQEEDLEYMRQYEAILDKQQQERLARLEKLKQWQVRCGGRAGGPPLRRGRAQGVVMPTPRSPQSRGRTRAQDKGEAKAAAMPESKRWIDPAIIQRNFEANEAARAAEEDRRRAAVVEGNRRMVSALNRQVAERAACEAGKRESDDAFSKAYLATAGSEQARANEERRRRLQLKLQVRHCPSAPCIPQPFTQGADGRGSKRHLAALACRQSSSLRRRCARTRGGGGRRPCRRWSAASTGRCWRRSTATRPRTRHA